MRQKIGITQKKLLALVLVSPDGFEDGGAHANESAPGVLCDIGRWLSVRIDRKGVVHRISRTDFAIVMRHATRPQATELAVALASALSEDGVATPAKGPDARLHPSLSVAISSFSRAFSSNP